MTCPRRSARSRLARAAVALALVALAGTSPVGGQETVEVVARGLEIPWALAFAPDGTLYLTERPGRLRAVRDGRLVPQPLAMLSVAAVGEGGLMGLALAADFARTGHLYVCYTARKGGGVVNRVSRLTLRDGRAGDERVVLDDVPGAPVHDGCRVKLGPDGKLYVTTGDAAEPRLAQRRESLAGKILRLNPDGTVPADNPFAGSPVYTLGHRNPQGLAWDAQGRLLAAEHGPAGHDEINRIVAGRNYGWPEVQGKADDPRFAAPLLESGDTTWAPSGIAARGDELFVATLRGQRLLRLGLDAERTAVVRSAVLLARRYGRLRDVVVGPDGALYVATSNRDGRGSPDAEDDRVLRLPP